MDIGDYTEPRKYFIFFILFYIFLLCLGVMIFHNKKYPSFGMLNILGRSLHIKILLLTNS